MVKRSVQVTRRPLQAEDNPIKDHASLSPAERMALAWDLSLQAWLLQGKALDDSPLSRHIVRIYRREG